MPELQINKSAGLFKSLWGKIFSPKRKEFPPLDLSTLITDMHSHLIPGIDDGAKTLEESILLIKQLSALGFRKLITTPHIMGDFYKNTPEIILNGLAKIQNKLKEEYIDVEINAAAEYYLDENFEKKIGREKLLTFGDNYILIEISYVYPPANIQQIIMELIMQGYTPILAHPERYPYWAGKFEEFQKLKDSGVLFQLNINSLTGHYSYLSMKMAHKMIDMNMIEFVGTDTHKMHHLSIISHTKTDEYLHKLFASGKLLNHSL
jgi:tyrosine-protein phosphatase YwqE